MPINGCQKGKRGEREWRDELREQGYLKARRGQQFAGGADSPDVVCPELEQFHFEVKRTEGLNVYKAYEQAARDAGTKTPVVAHKRNHRPWLVVISAETFFKLMRERNFDYPEETDGSRLAREIRESCNGMSKEDREKFLKQGIQIIYGAIKKGIPSRPVSDNLHKFYGALDNPPCNCPVCKPAQVS